MRRVVIMAAIGAAASGCCGRKVVERSITVQRIERRDTTIYRPALDLSSVIYLPRLDTLPFSVTTTDTATGATLIQAYSPDTRAVTATIHLPARVDTIPRVYERIESKTETIKEVPAAGEKCNHVLWLMAGMGIGAGLWGVAVLLSRLRLF